jgi:hypothetical protein
MGHGRIDQEARFCLLTLPVRFIVILPDMPVPSMLKVVPFVKTLML